MINKKKLNWVRLRAALKYIASFGDFLKAMKAGGLGEKLEVNVFTGGNMVKSKAGKGTKVSNAAWWRKIENKSHNIRCLRWVNLTNHLTGPV